jgi:hypothetical protein
MKVRRAELVLWTRNDQERRESRLPWRAPTIAALQSARLERAQERRPEAALSRSGEERRERPI